MDAQVTINASLNTPGNRFVLAWYTYPGGTLVNSVSPAGPYSPPFQVTITGLSDQVYTLILWENNSTSPGGTSRCSMNFQPSMSSVTITPDLYLTADISSGFTSGSSTYINSSLIGLSGQFDLELFGTGTLEAGTDYTFNNSTGQITFVNPSSISPGMRVIIHFLPQVSSAPPSSSFINTGEIITADTTLTSSDKNKAIFLQGAGSQLNIYLPALSTLSDYDYLVFYSNGGSHINASILCQGADKILWKVFTPSLIIAQYEQLKVFKANGVYNVDFVSDGVNKVGEIVDIYSQNEPNTVRLNGTELNRADYPRLWAWIQALPFGALVSDTSWSSTSTLNGQTYSINKGKFSTGNGTTTFRLPDLTAYGYRRNCVGSGPDVAGSFTNGTVGQFDANVDIPVGDSFTGPAGGGWGGYAGRGQNNEANQAYGQEFNFEVQNTPNATGVVACIRI